MVKPADRESNGTEHGSFLMDCKMAGGLCQEVRTGEAREAGLTKGR
jgi:hypothetical protein